MSTLKADTLVAADGTSPVTLTKQSAAKAWFNFRHDTATLNDSFGISSVTDESTGHHFGNYVNSMSNANSATPTMNDSFRTRFEGNLDQTSARTDTIEGYNSGGSAADSSHSVCIIQGDLA